MKIIRYLFFFFIFISATLNTNATHLLGGSVTYKSLGNNKYEVYVVLYRDCRGIPISSPMLILKNVNTKATSNISPTEISVSGITPICKKMSNPCSPQNTYGTGFGFEKHIYYSKIDLTNWKNAGACQVLIMAAQCCRSSSISTGAANQDFRVWAMIDLCKGPGNNSAVFAEEPLLSMKCNLPVKYNPAANDYDDNDSLAYELVDPMQDTTKKTSWGSGFNSQNPFSVYWPSSYDKTKGPNPTMNPPVGFYFNKLNGDVIFTPVDCSENTVWSMRVSEYRKDSLGKYKLVGYVTRDVHTIGQNSVDNILPVISASDITINDNIKTCFTVSTTDNQFIPPPPQKPNPPDTTELKMFPFTPFKNNSVTFNIIDPKARQKSAQVCWEPKGLARNQPYQMVFKVLDNYCTHPGISHKTINIYVQKSTNVAWIEGSTFYDKNKNCSLDTNESLLPNQKIVFGSYMIESDSGGKFKKEIPVGNFSFKVYNKFGAFVCTKTVNVTKGNTYQFDLGALPVIHITGTLYKDTSKNCKLETTEPKWANHMVYTDPGNYTSTTDANGKYDLKIPAGDYKIKYKPKGANFLVKCPLVPFVSGNNDTLFANQNIAVYDSGNVLDVSSNIITTNTFTRGGDQEITLVVKNQGSKVANGTLWFKFNKKLKYVSATTYVVKTDSTIKWDFTNLVAGDELRFYVVLNADASTCQMNDTMTLFSWLDTAGISKDIDLSNNNDKNNIRISGITNPNIKQEILSNGYTWREGNKLKYYIQFRNTGNKTVSNITVTDTLPFPLSGSSFQMLAASHANTYTINNNVLKVYFTGINLPDSTSDKIKSKGYFEFSAEIDKRTNSEIKFYNKAEIQFDTAKVVRTNKFYNTYTSYVSTGKTNATNYCLGDSLKVSYSSKFQFNAGNKFKLILSNPEGEFDSKAIVLDSVSSTSVSGILKAKLPFSLAGGMNYKAKVVSTNPYSAELSNGVSNSFKIFTSAYKPLITTKDSFFCSNDSIKITIDSQLDSIKIYDRKVLVGYAGKKTEVKLKLLPGKHNITAKGKVTSGCSFSSDTLIIRNDTLPRIDLSSTSHPNLNGCVGDTVSMKASGANRYVFYNYKFDTLAQNSTGIYANKGSFTAGTSIIKTIGESKTGCKDTSNFLTFNFYNKPNIELYGSDPDWKVCKGETVNFSGNGGISYQLYKNGSLWLSKFTNSITSADFKDQDKIELWGINNGGQGCGSFSGAKFITVNLTPEVTLTSSDADLILCEGSAYSIFKLSGGSKYTVYKNGSPVIITSDSTHTENGIKDNDVFYAESTNPNGCKGMSKQLKFKVVKKPVISLTVNNGGPACDGDSIRFDLKGGLSYDLYKNSGLWQSTTKQFHVVKTMAQNDKVFAQGSDSFGCKANSAQYTFNMLKSPTAVITNLDPDNTHCDGDLIGLKLSGAVFFRLYKNNILWKDTVGTNTDFKDIVNNDEIYAIGIASNLCRGFSNKIKFTIHPLPSMPLITRTHNTLISSYTSGNQWFEGITKISGETNQKFFPSKFSHYFVQYTDMNGCAAMSDKHSYTTGISKLELPGLKIYPNPATDHITIETPEAGHYKIKLIDITGKLIKETSFIGKRFEWNFNIEKGIYQLMISNDKGQVKIQSLEINQ